MKRNRSASARVGGLTRTLSGVQISTKSDTADKEFAEQRMR